MFVFKTEANYWKSRLDDSQTLIHKELSDSHEITSHGTSFAQDGEVTTIYGDTTNSYDDYDSSDSSLEEDSENHENE